MIHFDTNFLVDATKAGTAADQLVGKLMANNETFGISSIALAEYYCGPLDEEARKFAKQMFPTPEPFLLNDAILAADLFNKTGRRSRSLADCMIAAVAIRCGAKLATNNTSDSQKFASLGLNFA